MFPLGSLAVDGDARTRLAIELVEGKDAGRDSVWLLVNLPGFCCHRLVGCEDSKLCVSRGSKGSRRRRLIAVVVCLVRSQDAEKVEVELAGQAWRASGGLSGTRVLASILSASVL